VGSDTGRVLSVDLGDVRIGLAISDPLGITAEPLEPLGAIGKKRDLQAVERLVSEMEVATVVVGWPLLLSGEEGPRALAAREFADRLRMRLRGVNVLLWDERLTTVEAERVLIEGGVRRRKRRGKVDGLAAVLILTGFLDSDRQGDGGEIV